MQHKDFIALLLIAVCLTGGVLLCSVSKRIRDVLFVMMIFLAPFTELIDVNFVSRDFYRGTVRGFEFSGVDILSISILLGCIVAPRRGNTRLYWVPSIGFFLLYVLYCCFNIAIHEPRLFGLFELLKMVRGMVMMLTVALYLRSERELRILLWALAAIICYEGFLALKQRYLWGVHRVFGTVDHSNSLSALLCIAVPVFVAAYNSRLSWKMKVVLAGTVAASAVGVILTISRAGVVILGIGFLCTALATTTLKITTRKIGISFLIVLGAAGLLAKSWKTLQERFHESTLDQEYGASSKHNQGRGYYIRLAEAISAEQFFGVGLNNWSYWVSNKYGPRLGYHFNPYKGTDIEPSYKIPEGINNIDDPQAAPAHNLGALTVGELGIPGLIIFGMLWLRWFQMGASFLWPRTQDPMRQVAIGVFFTVVCMLLQSLTEWVFRHSPIYYVFHILIGTLASLYYIKRHPRPVEVTEEDAEDEAAQEDLEPGVELLEPEQLT